MNRSLPAPSRATRAVSAARAVLILLALMWGEEILDQTLFGGRLDALGIVPRSEIGLRGLIFAPFLHVGFGHLIANTIPCGVLGFLVALRSVARFVTVTLTVMLLGGLGVWLTAPSFTVHLGASLLVFGYLGYLLGRGFYERSAPAMIVAVLVLLAYGGALWGVLPLQAGVSWQSHLFGLLAGVLAAR